MSAELVRVVCNRPGRGHTLAVVSVGVDGDHLVDFKQAVLVGVNDYNALPSVVPISELEGRLAYCAACGKVYPLNSATLADAVRRGVRRVVAEPIGYHRDPLRILRKRHARRI